MKMPSQIHGPNRDIANPWLLPSFVAAQPINGEMRQLMVVSKLTGNIIRGARPLASDPLQHMLRRPGPLKAGEWELAL